MKKIQNSIFLLLISSLSVFSQENDFQSWYSFSVKKKVIKKTDIMLKSGLRFRENSSIRSKQFFDLKIKRKLTKRFSCSSGYRYASNWNKKDYLSNNHRFYSDLSYNNKLIKRFNYSIRNRWQAQGYVSAYKMTFRQKFTLSYNIRKTKLKPDIATEYFLNLDNGFNKLRSTFSVSYPINKKLDFACSYRIEEEFYVNNPETLFIFEGKISYNL